jgi:HPt (histidine-containing phosphotransfer) domain-containing protein
MVDHELDELKREFLDEARTKVEEMQTALDGTDGAETLERLAYLAHQLKGSGGSYGYADISSNAAELEKAVETLDGGPSALDGARERLRGYVSGLRTTIDSAAAELG